MNQLRNERLEDDHDILSNSNSTNNFDITAEVVSNERPRNLIRRPITRAAGYDSRAHNLESNLVPSLRRNFH